MEFIRGETPEEINDIISICTGEVVQIRDRKRPDQNPVH